MQRGWKGAALALAATMMLAGGALAQRGFGRGGGFGGNVLSMPEVQAELKLTDEQKTKVTDALAKLREQRQSQGQDFQSLSQEERQKLMADRRAEEDKQLGAILNADQVKRYHQLVLQRQGMTAVLDKPVADELKLTDDQRTKIQAVLGEQRAAMQELRQNGGGGDREAIECLEKSVTYGGAAVLRPYVDFDRDRLPQLLLDLAQRLSELDLFGRWSMAVL